MMDAQHTRVTRRNFVKGVGGAALGATLGLPASAFAGIPQTARSRVVLIRNEDAVSSRGRVRGEVIERMLDEAVMALFGRDDPAECWRQIIRSDDVVGIKSNEWRHLPTPREVEGAIRRRVLGAGVSERNLAVQDRGALRNRVFRNATALVNTRPMRTHAWSGVGSLIKNYIMFVPRPPDYHADACANLAALWNLPITRGKTRLNVLVMLTPQFHNVGPHHFDRSYVWPYKGLIVSADPVAADSVGLRVIQQQRRLAFDEDRPLQPTAHHIALADTEHGLGNADPSRIELVKLGWMEDSLL